LEEWLDAVLPMGAIISAGYQNKYEHPDNETLDRLLARNITIFRTDIREAFIESSLQQMSIQRTSPRQAQGTSG